MSNDDVLDVVVIGAGVSGLAAASELSVTHKWRVAVLEARDRIGGRVVTVDVATDNTRVDLGASWIHGLSGNPIRDVMTSLDTVLRVIDEDEGIVVDETGAEVADKDIERAGRFSGSLMKQLDKVIDAWPSDQADVSLEVMLEHAYKQCQLMRDAAGNAVPWSQLRCSEDATVQCLALELEVLRHYNGTELTAVSGVRYNDDTVPPGDQPFVCNGYDRLPRHLARGLDIRLGQAVRTVDWTDASAVRLTTATGDVLHARCVLVTASIGVLAADPPVLTFTPPLPRARSDAMAHLGMGVLNKLVLVFDTVFWPREVSEISFVAETVMPFAINLLPLTGTSGLLFFIAGDDAVAAETQLSQQQATARAMALLRRTYKDTPQPCEVHLTRWLADEYARGSYTYVKVGAPPDVYQRVAEPVKQRLFFAGEGTSTMYAGTVHGAYHSGLQAAAQMHQALGAIGTPNVDSYWAC